MFSRRLVVQTDHRFTVQYQPTPVGGPLHASRHPGEREHVVPWNGRRELPRNLVVSVSGVRDDGVVRHDRVFGDVEDAVG